MNLFRTFVFVSFLVSCSGCISFTGVSNSWLVNKDEHKFPFGSVFYLNHDVQSVFSDKSALELDQNENICYRNVVVSDPKIALWYRSNEQTIVKGTKLVFKSVQKSSAGICIWPFPGIVLPLKTRYQFDFYDEESRFSLYFIGRSEKWWKQLPLAKFDADDNVCGESDKQSSLEPQLH